MKACQGTATLIASARQIKESEDREELTGELTKELTGEPTEELTEEPAVGRPISGQESPLGGI